MSRYFTTQNVILYVRPDGNDANYGIENTSSGACATIQGAYTKLISAYDFGGLYNATIKVADGEYSSGLLASNNPVGTSYITIEGNIQNPENVVLNTTSHCFEATHGSKLIIKGFKLNSSLIGLCSIIQSSILFSNMDFGDCLYHLYVSRLAYMEILGDYTISGNAVQHIQASHNGNFRGYNSKISIINDLTFSQQFAYASSLADITFTGPQCCIETNNYNVTGQRFRVDENGVIQVVGLGNDFFPGSYAGVTASGGVYFC